MGLKQFELVWSIFTGNALNFGKILWDDFLQYISKENPREDPTELTCERFRSIYISDLHKDAKLSMGDEINLFFTRDLKIYTTSKDQSIFKPLRRLPTHILQTIGTETQEVNEPLEATDGIDPYHSSSPHSSQPISVTTATQGPRKSAPAITTIAPHSEPQST